MSTYLETVTNYFVALDSGDLNSMMKLFSSEATVNSPFLGRLPAKQFFPKVFGATAASSISVFDILTSAQGKPRAVGYFSYDWTLKDGTVINFDAADVFNFNIDGEIEELIILYDTHPIRGMVGDKYE